MEHMIVQTKGRLTHSMPFPCRARAVPLPCRAAKGLECVFTIWFTQCGRVRPRPCPSSQGHGTARLLRGGVWAICSRSGSSG